ncbi:MAG: HAD family hydrolase [Betaproteobacteria bacterium]|nr:HAD family hydrolase [Betaproteobacteria bacterium]
MNLALFDLDNTLLDGDSDYEWAQFLIDEGVLERETYEARNNFFYEQYQAGTLDIFEFLDFQLAPLARYPRSQLDAWHARFMQSRIEPIMLDRARALVDLHLERGDLCAIVTATNSFITAPIAAAFGVAHLIATEPEARDGRFTGKPAGTPCFREGKITRLEAWLAGQGKALTGFEESAFFSDSQNDLALLLRVTRPVAVDPDPVLLQTARDSGWQILSLKQPAGKNGR